MPYVAMVAATTGLDSAPGAMPARTMRPEQTTCAGSSPGTAGYTSLASLCALAAGEGPRTVMNRWKGT